MARSEMGHQNRAAKCYSVEMMQSPVDWMRFSSRPDRLCVCDIAVHDHDRGASQLLDQCISLAVIGVGMTGQQDFDVRKLEPQLFYRSADQRHVTFISAVEENISRGSRNQKRRMGVCYDEVDVPDKLMRRKCLV